MNKEQIKDFLRNNKGYLKWGAGKLATKLNSNFHKTVEAIKEIKSEDVNCIGSGSLKNCKTKYTKEDLAGLTSKEHLGSLYGLLQKESKGAYVRKSKSTKSVLVVGDLHLPFTLEGYLEHCIEVYKKYNCDTVVFIGDILDLHFTSYHETSTEGYGATEEHDLSVEMLRKWYKAFPKAFVTIGNHDALIYRKAMSAGISKRWIQNYSQVLGTPGWEWVTDVVIDDVLYTHGTTNAYTKAKQNLMSTVQGHLHSQAGIQFYVGAKSRIFGFQVGCGVDMKSYAMEYGRNFPKPVISCGVVIDGLHPYLEVMTL